MLLNIDGVGRYRIDGGYQILIDPDPDVPQRNLRLFLLGSAFGVLLHQRGLLPLHANAIEIGGRAVAFMGESGSGKSTLAAWFHDHGFRIIADDVCVVQFGPSGSATIVPGLSRLRLSQEILEMSGRDPQKHDRSYAGEYDKFDVPIAHGDGPPGELNLAAIYVLERGDALAIRRLEGIEAAESIFAHTYRGAFIAAVKGEHSHWSGAVRLVQQTPLFRLERTWDLGRMDEELGHIVDHAAWLVRPHEVSRA